MGKLSSAQTEGVKIGGIGVVAKSAASVDDTEATLSARMHGDQVRVVLHQLESSTDVVVGQVDLVGRVSDSEVVKPHHKLHLGRGEGEGWLVVRRGPIINGPAPGFGLEETIENRPRALMRGIEVHHALWSEVTVEH